MQSTCESPTRKDQPRASLAAACLLVLRRRLNHSQAPPVTVSAPPAPSRMFAMRVLRSAAFCSFAASDCTGSSSALRCSARARIPNVTAVPSRTPPEPRSVQGSTCEDPGSEDGVYPGLCAQVTTLPPPFTGEGDHRPKSRWWRGRPPHRDAILDSDRQTRQITPPGDDRTRSDAVGATSGSPA